ncbi:aspartate-semialdehyde dehydrogenase [bacterium]|nr:aspartate-semialdehyde dehydrogenase [bacterium]
MKKYRVAIVGATGAVGNEMKKILEERDFPLASLKLLASHRSTGRVLLFKGEEVTVCELKKDSFKDVDIALFSAGGAISKEFAPIAVKNNVVVVDNSSDFRMDPEVPLVVPEVNSVDLEWHKGIIANPNCSTIQMVAVLAPLHKEAKIKRVVVSTYQSVSGTGLKAMIELREQTLAVLNKEKVRRKVYPHQIAFNCLPQIDVFLDNDYTKEEMKMVNETKKIMGDDQIKVTATTVRVPVFLSHSESVNIEFEKEISARKAKKILSKAEGVIVLDNPLQNLYPLAINAAGKDEVYVGRIRKDETVPFGLNLWIVSDNLRKGAALNAVQIAEKLIERGLI